LEVRRETVRTQIIGCARLCTDSSERSGIHILSSAPYFSSYLYGARYKLQFFFIITSLWKANTFIVLCATLTVNSLIC